MRLISSGFHDLIHKVSEPVQEIFKIGSMSPGSILLMASQVGIRTGDFKIGSMSPGSILLLASQIGNCTGDINL